MPRKIAYWAATGVVGIVTLLAAFSYLTSAPQAVENFRHMGYPQQLRILLGIGKLAGAIVLLVPRLPTLKEWAYAGFTFMWIAATVAHYLAADGIFLLPVALIGILGLSYVTRPANRRGSAKPMLRAAWRLKPPSGVRAVRRLRPHRRRSSCVTVEFSAGQRRGGGPLNLHPFRTLARATHSFTAGCGWRLPECVGHLGPK